MTSSTAYSVSARSSGFSVRSILRLRFEELLALAFLVPCV
jgi:hypothetical protein